MEKKHIVSIVRKRELSGNSNEENLRTYIIDAASPEEALGKAAIQGKKIVFKNHHIALFEVIEDTSTS